jgi:hypothetical protein
MEIQFLVAAGDETHILTFFESVVPFRETKAHRYLGRYDFQQTATNREQLTLC